AVSVMHLEDVHSDEMPLLEALSELRRRADFMIADVSELNDNVIFEIGRAFESGMDIVLVAQEHAAIPMALDSAPMVWYRQEEIYSDDFAASILSAFKKLPRMTQKQNSLCSQLKTSSP